MDELTEFQARTLSHYERKVAIRYFIAALFRIEIITSSDLDAMGSRNCELVNHEIMYSLFN
jgi:hypothetical protein